MEDHQFAVFRSFTPQQIYYLFQFDKYAAQEAVYTLRNEVSKYAARYLDSLFSGRKETNSRLFELLSSVIYGEVVQVISVASVYLAPYNDPARREELYTWIMKCFTAKPYSKQDGYDINEYILSFKPPNFEAEAVNQEHLEEISLAFSFARKAAERFLAFASQLQTPIQFVNPEQVPQQYMMKPGYMNEWTDQSKYQLFDGQPISTDAASQMPRFSPPPQQQRFYSESQDMPNNYFYNSLLQGFDGGAFGGEYDGNTTTPFVGGGSGSAAEPAPAPAPAEDEIIMQLLTNSQGSDSTYSKNPTGIQMDQQKEAEPVQEHSQGQPQALPQQATKAQAAQPEGQEQAPGHFQGQPQGYSQMQGQEQGTPGQVRGPPQSNIDSFRQQQQEFARSMNRKSPSPAHVAGGNAFNYSFDEIFPFHGFNPYPENGNYLVPIQGNVPPVQPNDPYVGAAGPGNVNNENISQFFMYNPGAVYEGGMGIDSLISPIGTKPKPSNILEKSEEDLILSNGFGYKDAEIGGPATSQAQTQAQNDEADEPQGRTVSEQIKDLDMPMSFAELDVRKRTLEAPNGEHITFLTSLVLALWYLESFRGKFYSIKNHNHSAANQKCFYCSFRKVLIQLASPNVDHISVKNLREALTSSTIVNGKDESLFPLYQKNPSCILLLKSLMRLLHKALAPSTKADQGTFESEFDVRYKQECDCGIHDLFSFIVDDTTIESPNSQKTEVLRVNVDHHEITVSKLLQFRSKFKSDTFDALIGKLFSVHLRREAILRRDCLSCPNIISLSLKWGPSTSSRTIDSSHYLEKELGPLLSVLSPHIDVSQVYRIRNETADGEAGESAAANAMGEKLAGMSYYCESVVCLDVKYAETELIYVSFSYSKIEKQWVLFDCSGHAHKAIGSRWGDLISYCKKSKYFPMILFYERGHQRKLAAPSAGPGEASQRSAWGMKAPPVAQRPIAARGPPAAQGSSGVAGKGSMVQESVNTAGGDVEGGRDMYRRNGINRSIEHSGSASGASSGFKDGYIGSSRARVDGKAMRNVAGDASATGNSMARGDGEIRQPRSEDGERMRDSSDSRKPEDGDQIYENIPLDDLKISGGMAEKGYSGGDGDDVQKEKLIQGLHGDTMSVMKSLQKFMNTSNVSPENWEEVDVDRLIREANTVCPYFLQGECANRNCGYYHPNDKRRPPMLPRQAGAEAHPAVSTSYYADRYPAAPQQADREYSYSGSSHSRVSRGAASGGNSYQRGVRRGWSTRRGNRS